MCLRKASALTSCRTTLTLPLWKGDAQTYIIKLSAGDGTPIDLTGYTAQAVVRASFNAPLTYPFACTIMNTNEVRLYMSSAVSKSIPAGDYVWNFQLTDTVTNDVRTYLAGDVTVYAEVDG
jgi:hypothetical protein